MTMHAPLDNDLLLRAARRRPVERTPVWMMRQAGRYLPEYRAVREKTDFLTLCRTPQLAAEVSVQPVDLVGVDAAIIFSDILVVPEAMGMELVVEEGKGGPRFPTPLRSAEDIARLRVDGAVDRLQYVYDALAATRAALHGRVPLIGFCGAPWTLAAYAVEGRGAKDFEAAKTLLYTAPDTLRALLDKLADVCAAYLVRQVRAGADIVQIFDTWAGLLSRDAFLTFSLPTIARIAAHVKTETGVPVIVFARGAAPALPDIAACGCDVVGLDWTVGIDDAARNTGGHVALQGNLDPLALLAPPDAIRMEVGRVLAQAAGCAGHIFNLGHGILPHTPPAHARAMVEAVKELSAGKAGAA
jgi:uroporphyrinogen decarboxylase